MAALAVDLPSFWRIDATCSPGGSLRAPLQSLILSDMTLGISDFTTFPGLASTLWHIEQRISANSRPRLESARPGWAVEGLGAAAAIQNAWDKPLAPVRKDER